MTAPPIAATRLVLWLGFPNLAGIRTCGATPQVVFIGTSANGEQRGIVGLLGHVDLGCLRSYSDIGREEGGLRGKGGLRVAK